MFGMKKEELKYENNFEGTHSNIFAKISKYAVTDPSLSCEAKGFYALLCTYGAFDGNVTTNMKRLCKDLAISRKKAGNILLELSSQDYIKIKKVKSKGRFAKNHYEITLCPAKYQDMIPENAKEAYALEKIKENGIQSYGYGLAEQRILFNSEVDLKAKGIYAYFCALAGNTSTAYPSVAAILNDLQICEGTYYKYIKQLVQARYVQIIEHKTDDGRYSPNEYKLLGHPNANKPSNYDANVSAMNERSASKKAGSPPTKKADSPSAPSIKNDTQPYPKNDTRQEYDKSYDKSTEIPVKPCPEKPSVNLPSTNLPFPKNDTLYNTNTVNTNSSNKNTLNQAGENFEKNFKPSSDINQSASTSKKIKKPKKSDSIDNTENTKFADSFVNSGNDDFANYDRLYNELLNTQAIPLSSLKNKSSLEFIIKTLSDNADNAESSKYVMSESMRAFLIKNKIRFNIENPPDKKFRQLVLNCLANMLYETGNAYRKHNPEEIARLVNTHIKVTDGVASFDTWLEQFEKSFMQSASKPEVSGNIKNIYAYVKASIWKFLSTYDDFYRVFHKNSMNGNTVGNTDSNSNKQAPAGFNSDQFFDKIARNSMKLRE